MKKLFAVLVVFPLIVSAQKKNFTYDQLFKGSYPNVMKSLPVVERWLDDDHYIVMQTDEHGWQTTLSVEAATGKSKPYSITTEKETEIKGAINLLLSPDKKFAAYTKSDNNLYITELATGKETAITRDGSDVILNGYASWVYYEEILGRSSAYKAFWWSPDSKKIAFMRFDDSQVRQFPIYVADGQYGYLEIQRYPKAGDKNPEVKIGVAGIDNNTITWADFDEKRDQYFGTLVWTPSSELFVQWMNRGQDTLIVYNVHTASGNKKEIYKETQSTWINLDDDDRFHFLSDSKSFIIKSDKDKWDNLYLYDMNGKLINQITKGNFWQTSILHVDEKNKTVYIRARKEHSTRFDLYKVTLNGKSVTRLSSGDFNYEQVNISPNAKYIIATYSNLSTLPTMAIIDNKGKKIRDIANMKGKEFDDYFIPQTKMLTVKSADGQFDLPLTITYPKDFDPTKKYPVWISVYGGPNAGTVYDRWKPVGGLTQYFAQEGIIQIAMDNRSSGHFGREGINYIFKQLGKYEIEDFMHCARWIRSQSWADANKIGITGGSYGGYMTCMALTYGANVFTHGIALYSVTDWSLYDSHYTERFMKTPQLNPKGYEQTSVLTYADKYKGVLKIVHGSTDDNVHMQNSYQLIDKLQDLNKSFEMMVYPNQRHGIRPPKALHNINETIRFVNTHLLK